MQLITAIGIKSHVLLEICKLKIPVLKVLAILIVKQEVVVEVLVAVVVAVV